MKHLLPGLAAIILAAVAPSTAAAHASHGRHAGGIIQKVDRQAHRLELKAGDGPRPLHLSWNAHTTFAVGARLADEAILVPGAKVAVVYYDPLFGPAILTKVRLVSAP